MRALQFKSGLLALKLGCDHRTGPPEDTGLMLALSRLLLTFQQHLPKPSFPRGVILSKQGWWAEPLPALHTDPLETSVPPLTLAGSVFPRQGQQPRMGSILGAGG